MKKENLDKLNKLEQEARQRILNRGKIEFRVEPELMSALLDLAKKQRKPLGPMIRQWVKTQLEQETKRSAADRTQLDVIEQKIDKLLSKRLRA